MNRRNFLKSLGIATAALTLRFRPEPPPRLYLSSDFKTVRRTVYYAYPNQATPLIGLLTLLKDDVDNEPISWWETPGKV